MEDDADFEDLMLLEAVEGIEKAFFAAKAKAELPAVPHHCQSHPQPPSHTRDAFVSSSHRTAPHPASMLNHPGDFEAEFWPGDAAPSFRGSANLDSSLGLGMPRASSTAAVARTRERVLQPLHMQPARPQQQCGGANIPTPPPETTRNCGTPPRSKGPWQQQRPDQFDRPASPGEAVDTPPPPSAGVKQCGVMQYAIRRPDQAPFLPTASRVSGLATSGGGGGGGGGNDSDKHTDIDSGCPPWSPALAHPPAESIPFWRPPLATAAAHLDPIPSATAGAGCVGPLQDARHDLLVIPAEPVLRPYQLEMVKTAVMTNTLVSLPTGSGKTLIAAVVMYNFLRWFPQRNVVFLAPTRPLVKQQMEVNFPTPVAPCLPYLH